MMFKSSKTGAKAVNREKCLSSYIRALLNGLPVFLVQNSDAFLSPFFMA